MSNKTTDEKTKKPEEKPNKDAQITKTVKTFDSAGHKENGKPARK